MNTKLLTTLSSLAAFCLATPSLDAASFNRAKVTRLEKDVKILKQNAAPHAAAVGEDVTAVTSVATGASSRAELTFPDKSLTRLGANSRFTVRGEKHTIDLDSGVMLIEVPEKLRDAKVRTAAVTAAVTGGTMIFEFLPGGFVKIMVVEGIVDLFLTNKPSEFATLHAGQMIIQPVNATTLSPAVDFDLKLLLKTSKLISGEGEPNSKQISDALSAQQALINDGELVKTNLVIPGLGTIVQLDNDSRLSVLDTLVARNVPPAAAPQGGGGNNGGGNGAQGGGTPPKPSFQGAVPLISGLTVLNAHSFIKTDPKVTAFNVGTGTSPTSDGAVYNAATDGPFPYFGFGSLQIGDPELAARLQAKGEWAAYKFEALLINGTPRFDLATFYCDDYGGGGGLLATNGAIVVDHTIPNVILSALGDITLAADNQYSTGPGSDGETTSDSLKTKKTGLEALLLYSQNGGITLAQDFQIKAANQEITLVAAGPTSDVTIQGDINIYNGTLLASAGQDLSVSSNVAADAITFRGGRDVTISGNGGGEGGGPIVEARNGDLRVSAKRDLKVTNVAQLRVRGTRSIKIADSAQLKTLSELPPDALLRLESQQGAITVDGNSYLEGPSIEIEAANGNINLVNSLFSATNAFKARMGAGSGTFTIGGPGGPTTINAGQLIHLYAETITGGSTNGRIYFAGPTSLGGGAHADIAAKTVEIKGGVDVDVTGTSALHVYTDNQLYNIANKGQFLRNGVQDGNKHPSGYAGRPAFGQSQAH